MRLNGFCRFGILAGLVGPWMAVGARGDVFNLPSGQTSLSLVTVGDPGNAPDTTGFGAVPYTYQIGQFDVTVSQYSVFLNSVAKTDSYGLWNLSMSPENGTQGGIVQSGSPGSFSYSIADGHANYPISDVSWGDAARFCNWLANGQPTTGVENAATTESGSYALNGAVSDRQLAAVVRAPFATYVIPTENEWYKSAYYKGGSVDAGYWLFPTQNDNPPSNVLSAIGTNNANFDDPILGGSNVPHEYTDVGAFASSPSAYGTFDQGGDVFQWNESIVNSVRGVRGGSFDGQVVGLESGTRLSTGPSNDGPTIGFRVAEVPEPNSICIVMLAGSALLRRRSRR
jgi:formylglycine-generating enzyme required for sulfatase activity